MSPPDQSPERIDQSWADRLWWVTYSPHKPGGSDDRLYAVNDQLDFFFWPESVGGTPANRMIHRETRQLLIGPYLIDTVEPNAATNLTSSTHTAGVWSNDPNVTFNWTAASDTHSGISGYGIFTSFSNPGSPTAVHARLLVTQT